MGKYDDAAGEAAAETDAELYGKLRSIGTIDAALLDEMIPSADREYVNQLIAAVDKSTNDNSLANAWKNFASNATDFGIKAARKLILGM